MLLCAQALSSPTRSREIFGDCSSWHYIQPQALPLLDLGFIQVGATQLGASTECTIFHANGIAGCYPQPPAGGSSQPCFSGLGLRKRWRSPSLALDLPPRSVMAGDVIGFAESEGREGLHLRESTPGADMFRQFAARPRRNKPDLVIFSASTNPAKHRPT